MRDEAKGSGGCGQNPKVRVWARLSGRGAKIEAGVRIDGPEDHN